MSLSYPTIPTTKTSSLHSLIIWLEKNQSMIGLEEVVNIFKQNDVLCDETNLIKSWFGHMRATRDDIAHRGIHPLVFGEPTENILFQVYDFTSYRTLIPTINHIKHTDSLIDFRKYCVVQLSSLLILQNSIIDLLIIKFGFNSTIAFQTGFSELKQWVDYFLNQIDLYSDHN